MVGIIEFCATIVAYFIIGMIVIRISRRFQDEALWRTDKGNRYPEKTFFRWTFFWPLIFIGLIIGLIFRAMFLVGEKTYSNRANPNSLRNKILTIFARLTKPKAHGG